MTVALQEKNKNKKIQKLFIFNSIKIREMEKKIFSLVYNSSGEVYLQYMNLHRNSVIITMTILIVNHKHGIVYLKGAIQ